MLEHDLLVVGAAEGQGAVGGQVVDRGPAGEGREAEARGAG